MAEKKSTRQCNACKRIFFTSKSYMEHFRTCSTKGKRYFICNICQKAFQLRIGLKRHVNYHVHDGEKTLCDKCDKIFPSTNMTNHVCIPSKEILFPCDECPNIYSSESNLKLHKRRTHPETPKCFVCMDCKSEFHSKLHLEQHQDRRNCMYISHYPTEIKK